MDSQVPISREMPPNKDSKLPIISMAIFILLSLASVAFLYYQNQQLKKMILSYQPQPSSTPSVQTTPDPTADWKTYANSNYTLKYPTDYTIQESANDVKLISDILPQFNTKLSTTISYSPTTYADLDMAIKNNNWCAGMGLMPKSPYLLDRQEGYIFTDTPCGQSGSTIIYTIHNNDLYLIKIEASAVQFEEVKNGINQILSTFRFIDQNANNPIVTTPLANSKITSPVTITGTIPKSWTFEANFVIEIQNKNRGVITVSPSQVLFNNETDLIGKFSTSVNFDTTAIEGYIVIKSDNPSGLSELQKTFEIPVKFQ